MRRWPICALLLAACLAAPAAAQAHLYTCSCTRPPTRDFVHSRRALHRYNRVFRRTMVWVTAASKERARRQVKRRFYDWAKEGDFDPDNFCKKHRRVCKAAVVCVINGTLAAFSVRGAGGSPTAANLAFASACASSSATVMLYG